MVPSLMELHALNALLDAQPAPTVRAALHASTDSSTTENATPDVKLETMETLLPNRANHATRLAQPALALTRPNVRVVAMDSCSLTRPASQGAPLESTSAKVNA
jgi:hypothetical protein